jgi:hypothetical protein
MNSSCVIVIHSISDGPSSPSRARNASSDVGAANEFQGHTSWEMCRLPRFSIPLSTGRRTPDEPRLQRGRLRKLLRVTCAVVYYGTGDPRRRLTGDPRTHPPQFHRCLQTP